MSGVQGSGELRRSSKRTSQRSHHSDPLDELENDRRSPLGRPNSPIDPGSIRGRALKKLEDRRRWAPSLQNQPQKEPARDASGRHARHVYKKRVVSRSSPRARNKLQSAPKVTRWAETPRASFASARNTFICLKRKVRREVLHALRRTRSGKGSPKRRNEWSDIQC